MIAVVTTIRRFLHCQATIIIMIIIIINMVAMPAGLTVSQATV